MPAQRTRHRQDRLWESHFQHIPPRGTSPSILLLLNPHDGEVLLCRPPPWGCSSDDQPSSSSNPTCKAVANLCNVSGRGVVFPDSIRITVNLETLANSASRCRLSPLFRLAILSLLWIFPRGFFNSYPTFPSLHLIQKSQIEFNGHTLHFGSAYRQTIRPKSNRP